MFYSKAILAITLASFAKGDQCAMEDREKVDCGSLASDEDSCNVSICHDIFFTFLHLHLLPFIFIYMWVWVWVWGQCYFL